jgi:methionyl-tRNA formyltransferase
MRIVLFGDGDWATRTLLCVRSAGHDIAAVVLRARPSEDGLARTASGLDVPILQPQNVNAPECVERVRALAADVHLSIAYNQIFRGPMRAAAPWFLNVHAGKLPQYRGRNVINWAIINGEREIGVTVHLVDDGIDTGNIVLQRTLPIEWTDTYGDVLHRVVRIVPDLVTECLELIASGAAQPRPQPEGGTYFCGRRDGDEWLDWSQTSLDLHNKIRGISRPGPGARTMLGNDVVIVWRAAYDLEWPRYRATPGDVVNRSQSEGVYVKTADSTVLVQEVQIGNAAPHVPTWSIGTRLGMNPGTILHGLLNGAALHQHR